MDSSEGVDHELRQARLSRFGRVLAFVTLGFVVLNLSTSLWLHRLSANKSSLPLSVSTVAFAVLWLLLRADVKPGNIMVVDRGGISDLVKVVDFGLVKVVGIDGAEAALTMANAITGPPLYIAPETLIAPDSVDARADLYALGAVGYWLLTGRHVFGGSSIVEVFAHHLHSPPVSPSARLGAPVAADLETLLLACLAKRPEDRPATAHVLRDRLRACASAGLWTTREPRNGGRHTGTSCVQAVQRQA